MKHLYRLRVFNLLGAFLLLNGCATTSIGLQSTGLKTEIASFPTTLKTNDTHAPYQHIAVFATSVDDLIRKQNIEHAFCQALKPTPCISMLSLFPPFHDYTTDEGLQRLTQNDIDAILIVAVNEDDINPSTAGANTYQVKQKVTISKDLKLIKSDPSNQNYLGETQTGSKDAEESQTKVLPALSRHSEGKMLLIDTQSGQPAWGGAFETEGSGRNNIGNHAFAKSEAIPVANALRKAGLLGNGNVDNTGPSPQILPWLKDSPKSSTPDLKMPQFPTQSSPPKAQHSSPKNNDLEA